MTLRTIQECENWFADPKHVQVQVANEYTGIVQLCNTLEEAKEFLSQKPAEMDKGQKTQ